MEEAEQSNWDTETVEAERERLRKLDELLRQEMQHEDNIGV